MNLIINILVLVITGAAVGLFAFNLIINIIRGTKVNKQMQTNPEYVMGTVTSIERARKRVFVKVEYISKANKNKFAEIYEFSEKKFEDQYVEGQEVKIFYPNPKDLKKVNSFPTFLEGQKIKMELGPLFTDIMLFAGTAWIFVMLLIAMLTPKLASDGNTYIGLQWNGLPLISLFGRFNPDVLVDENNYPLTVTSGFYMLIVILFFFMLYPYIKERLLGMSATHKNNYLKLCGVKATAEVKTFKFTRNKGENGQKEAELQIEYFTRNGEKINCSLSSFLYSETQEQYIDILYDEKQPKNVVYMRK